MINKFLYLILFCTCKVGSIARNTITTLHETLTYAPNILSDWINKQHQQRHKKRHKTSHGGWKFSQNLHASNNLWYNERNCISGRYSQQHIFVLYKSQSKRTWTDNSDLKLKIIGKRKEKLNPLLLANAIECFVLSIVIIIVKKIMT